MKLNAVIEGLTILSGYYNHPDGFHTGAEHDALYAYATDKPIPPGVVKAALRVGLVPGRQEPPGSGFV